MRKYEVNDSRASATNGLVKKVLCQLAVISLAGASVTAVEAINHGLGITETNMASNLSIAQANATNPEIAATTSQPNDTLMFEAVGLTVLGTVLGAAAVAGKKPSTTA